MSEGRTTGMLAGLALAVWVGGVVWTAHSWRALREEGERARGRATTLTALRALAAEGAGYGVLREQVQADRGAPASLSELVSARMPGVQVDPTRGRRESLGDGWVRLEQDFVFEDVSIAGVMGLIDELESRRPPWRVITVDVRASAHSPGAGQVAMTVMALQPER